MKCIISFSKKFSKIFSFPKIGVLMRVENKKSHKAIKKNINFYINKETGTVQIYPKVNPKILYNKGHGSGTTGRTWRKHHDEFFYQCRPYLSGKVLEIGGGENSIAINKNKIDEILEKKKQEKPSNKITKKANLEISISSIFFPTQINIKLLNNVAEA